MDETFHEPNPGFKSLLSKWQTSDRLSANSDHQDPNSIAAIARRKSRFEAKKEHQERVAERKKTGDKKQLLASEKKALRQIKNVYQQPLADVSTFKPPVHPKNILEKDLIHAALAKNFVFSDLSKAALAPLVDAFEQCSFNEGDVIIKQGDPGDYFYIIKSGEVIFQVHGNEVGRTNKGSFGELSLLYTVRTCSDRVFAATLLIMFIWHLTWNPHTVSSSRHCHCSRESRAL